MNVHLYVQLIDLFMHDLRPLEDKWTQTFSKWLLVMRLIMVQIFLIKYLI
jgi:hypothetical protein